MVPDVVSLLLTALKYGFIAIDSVKIWGRRHWQRENMGSYRRETIQSFVTIPTMWLQK